jgi:hypothetical protein
MVNIHSPKTHKEDFNNTKKAAQKMRKMKLFTSEPHCCSPVLSTGRPAPL